MMAPGSVSKDRNAATRKIYSVNISLLISGTSANCHADPLKGSYCQITPWHARCFSTHTAASSAAKTKDGGHIMKNIFTSLSRLALLLGACAVTIPTSPVYSEGKANGKAKGKQKVEAEAKGKHGREAGELPYGLEKYTEKKGELPSGLQKKKDQDGQLTRGLEEGGKKVKSSSKGKKDFK